MRGLVALGLCVIASCGRLHFGDVTDAGVVDATVDAQLGPFGPPGPVGVINASGANDENPSLTDDLRELYFASLRPGLGSSDIYIARRNSADDAFGLPALVAELSTVSYDGSPKISRNGLTMWISTDRAGGLGSYDLWISQRVSRMDPWPAPVAVPELNSTAIDAAAFMNDAGDEVWFHSTRTGPRQLFHATNTCSGWCPPVPIDELNTNSDETDVSLSPDEKEIYWSSTRTGGLGDRDLWSASRPTLGDPWGNLTNLIELNSAAFDSDPWLSSDLRVMYFTSSRGGTRDLYFAIR